jgi:hypothetical protein
MGTAFRQLRVVKTRRRSSAVCRTRMTEALTSVQPFRGEGQGVQARSLVQRIGNATSQTSSPGPAAFQSVKYTSRGDPTALPAWSGWNPPQRSPAHPPCRMLLTRSNDHVACPWDKVKRQPGRGQTQFRCLRSNGMSTPPGPEEAPSGSRRPRLRRSSAAGGSCAAAVTVPERGPAPWQAPGHSTRRRRPPPPSRRRPIRARRRLGRSAGAGRIRSLAA